MFRSERALQRVGSYCSVEGRVVLGGARICCPGSVYVMRAPRSYTREDIVEIHTVGSPPLLGALVEALVEAGARPAEPGEFTRRAFLNGRIDLTQAEAVQAVIQARSEAELRLSQSQLAGAFRDAVRGLLGEALALRAELEAAIDFVGQDIELLDASAAAVRAGRLAGAVASLAGAEPAGPPKEGVCAAICGLPNAGKSSLLNALSGCERALVTHLAGTTRDTVEQSVEIDGIGFRLVDTAGLGRAVQAVDAEAVERARAAAAGADLVLLVLDGSRPLARAAAALWERLTSGGGVPVIVVVNKSDLPCGLSASDEGRLAQRGRIVAVSARCGEGLEGLRAAMSAAVRSSAVDRSAHAFWLTARHRAALARAGEALERARAALGEGLGLEFAAADLGEALGALGEIVGATTADDVLDLIFSRFCIGK